MKNKLIKFKIKKYQLLIWKIRIIMKELTSIRKKKFG